MREPYIGEIRMVGFSFAPVGWALCNGQLMAISQNDALFNLIGTTYGGDGQVTFALPNLQGRRVVHQGTGFTIGQYGGAEQVTLASYQIPQHSHRAMASSHPGTSTSPKNTLWAGGTASSRPYTPATGDAGMRTGIVSVTCSAPPFSARVNPLPWWIGRRPRRSGSAKVVCPSPP